MANFSRTWTPMLSPVPNFGHCRRPNQLGPSGPSRTLKPRHRPASAPNYRSASFKARNGR
jgi:hypothetical protein